jgi:hypothetical protein
VASTVLTMLHLKLALAALSSGNQEEPKCGLLTSTFLMVDAESCPHL